ncbi:MAG: single-stranded-DNA-specific exonuclease RecJ [Alphaproteobacteria bacterium]
MNINSLSNKKWVIRTPDFDEIEYIARKHDLPDYIARLLLVRGVEKEGLSAFLSPTLKDNLPSPFLLQDMEAMADFVADKILSGEKFGIFGDFDVDGATSTAILYRVLSAYGLSDISFYIPDRLREGYGPNINAMKVLKEQGAQTVFILDCGSTSHDVITQAKQDLGLDIIVLDHHQTEDKLPPADFIINPKRAEDNSGLEMMAACGVTFMACIALNVKLRERDYFKSRGVKEPDLRSYLDLLALGTVCDMVPLVGVNRLFVKAGFGQFQSSETIGLQRLMEVAKLSPPINTYHAGFVLGPRINAGSRIHKSDLGAKLLTTNDPEEALNIAWSLNDCNDKRKSIQETMEAEAIAKVEQFNLHEDAVIVVDDAAWHSGLSGLVAGKLKDKYGKPACVVTYALNADGSREGRGSGRSIIGVNIGKAFMSAVEREILIKGGGHAMAGGFTLDPDRLADLRAFLNAHIQEQLQSDPSLYDEELQIDALLTISGAQNIDHVEALERTVGPFGQDWPEPLFAFRRVKIFSPVLRGEKHVSFMMASSDGGGRMKAMAFSALDKPYGEILLSGGQQGKAFDIAGYLKINDWQGRRSVELTVKDIAISTE